jgi:hypothetical protein
MKGFVNRDVVKNMLNQIIDIAKKDNVVSLESNMTAYVKTRLIEMVHGAMIRAAEQIPNFPEWERNKAAVITKKALVESYLFAQRYGKINGLILDEGAFDNFPSTWDEQVKIYNNVTEMLQAFQDLGEDSK